MALNGWHPGEQAIRQKLHLDRIPATAHLYGAVSGDLPDQHSQFYTRNLPFLPATIVDSQGRPWGSVLAGPDGQPGFITYPTYNTLELAVKPWDGDPINEITSNPEPELPRSLIAGIGVEFSTRRRNKFAGKIAGVQSKRDVLTFRVNIDEAIGNCPKYINLRQLVPAIGRLPIVQHRALNMSNSDRLPEAIIQFIHESDTVFLGTMYEANPSHAARFPSHLGMNQRGGRKGFVRVKPSDGRTLVLPDYSGNRIMTSLGNIEATPLASMTFMSFTTGDILYVTGSARNIVGAEAQRVMPLQNAITTLTVSGYVFVHDALPVRQKSGVETERSPYSPPIRLLAEETKVKILDHGDAISATLSSIELHSQTIATFTWEASSPLEIEPGQAIILDLSSFIGAPQYQHMASFNPTSVNDNRIRTWTVSSAHDGPANYFSITVREKVGGTATTALFAIARKLEELKPDLLRDAKPLQLMVTVVGVSGEFTLPKTDIQSAVVTSDSAKERKMLWIAGGIGITPFLSMLKAISTSPERSEQYDIRLILSTREPATLLPLIGSLLAHANIRLSVDVFSREAFPDVGPVLVRKHNSRISQEVLGEIKDIAERKVYLCGPEPFENLVLGNLKLVGIHAVVKENFEY